MTVGTSPAFTLSSRPFPCLLNNIFRERHLVLQFLGGLRLCQGRYDGKTVAPLQIQRDQPVTVISSLMFHFLNYFGITH